MNTKTIPFIPINDGTVRMTIKWRIISSDNFRQLADNSELWEQEAMIFLLQLFGPSSPDHHQTLIP